MNLKKLREITQKTRGKGKEALDVRFVYRNISLLLTYFLIMTPITANQITFLMFIFGLAAPVAFYFNKFILGFVLILFSIVLDYCDGEVARYRNKSSKAGSFMDKIYHATSMPLMLLAISYQVYLGTGNLTYLIIGVIGSVFYGFGVTSRFVYLYILAMYNVKEEDAGKKDGLIKRMLRRMSMYEYYTGMIYLLILAYILNFILAYTLNYLAVAIIILTIYAVIKFPLQIITFYSDMNKFKTANLRK